MKVGIISSYKTRCGIASFAETLVSLLEDDFEIEVLPLDQFTLRHRHPRVQRVGDQEIEQIGARMPEFDVLNLQWEPGLLGSNDVQGIRRTKALFNHLVAAGKPVVVTAHTVVNGPPGGSFLPSIDPRFWYARKTQSLLRELDRNCQLTVVAHTPSDRAFFEYVVGLKRVVDHPLSHMRRDWPIMIKDRAPDYRKKIERIVGTGKKIVDVFGFLGEYKGIEVAIRAIRNLPDDYVLLIYGEVHPENVKSWMRIHPYVERLMLETKGEIAALQSVISSRGSDESTNRASSRLSKINVDLQSELNRRKQPLLDRVFFMGSPDDLEFAIAIEAVDICAFPYLEIGQSASGPVSHAIELQKKLAISRTKTFMELERYFPKALNFFEIGNDLQLAQLIEELAEHPPPSFKPSHDNNSLKQLYSHLFSQRYMPAGGRLRT